MSFKVLCICVVGLVSRCESIDDYQVVLVNNMLLPPRADSVNYTFNDGDLVSVTCAIRGTQDSHFNLSMQYNFSQNYPLPDETYNEYTQHSISNPIGFQLQMRAGNDKTRAVCKYERLSETSSIQINFYVNKGKHPGENAVNVVINGAPFRPPTSYEYVYLYTPNVQLNITCVSEKPDEKAVFNWISRSNTSPTSHVIVTLNDEKETFTCATVKTIIKVKLKSRDLYETITDCSMQMEVMDQTTTAHPSLELYATKNRYVVYEYKKEAIFNFTCTAKCTTPYNLRVNNKDGTPRQNINRPDKEKITGHIGMPEIAANNVLQCELLEKDSINPLMIRGLVFVPYVPPTTTTSSTTTTTTTKKTTITESSPVTEMLEPNHTTSSPEFGDSEKDGGGFLLSIAISVTCIVIILVSVVIYKIKKSKRADCNPQLQPGDVNYRNLSNNSSPIPPFPRQSDSHYAEPVDNAGEPTYCEPFTGPRPNVKNELYTLPVPKSRRKPADIQTNDPTYEELEAHQPNVTRHGKDDPNRAEIAPSAFKNKLNLMYAQVLPKMQRHNLNKTENMNVRDNNLGYAQVTPKNRREYVNVGDENTNYAEVAPMNQREYVDVGDDDTNYTQIQYVNSTTGSDYVEPAYCQPSYIKKKK